MQRVKLLFQHQVIRRNAREYAKSSVNMNNLMEAADRIEEVVEKSKHTSKNRKTQLSQKVARYEDISQNSVLSSKSNEQLNSIYKEMNRSPENLVTEVEKKIDPVSSDKIPLHHFMMKRMTGLLITAWEVLIMSDLAEFVAANADKIRKN